MASRRRHSIELTAWMLLGPAVFGGCGSGGESDAESGVASDAGGATASSNGDAGTTAATGNTGPTSSGTGATASETASDTGGTSDPDGSESGDTVVSYADDVRPLFATRCTLCHHANNAVGIDIADPFSRPDGLVGSVNTWAEAHPEGGTPPLNVDPGDPANSFIVEKIDGTDLDPGVAGAPMPWDIPRLTADEIAAVRQWITNGANDDAFYAQNVRPVFGNESQLGAGGGKCTYCHHSGEGAVQPNLSAPFDPVNGVVGVPSTIAPDLLRVDPGDPDSSVLVAKIEATEPGPFGSPMPLHFEPLTSEEVATVVKWIAAGAKND